MNSLLEQIKIRRKELNLKQKDMMLRVGMSPQQYQRLEAKGNPRLDTLELIAKGLNSELILIPKEKLIAVRAVLESNTSASISAHTTEEGDTASCSISTADDPWKGILKDDE